MMMIYLPKNKLTDNIILLKKQFIPCICSSHSHLTDSGNFQSPFFHSPQLSYRCMNEIQHFASSAASHACLSCWLMALNKAMNFYRITLPQCTRLRRLHLLRVMSCNGVTLSVPHPASQHEQMATVTSHKIIEKLRHLPCCFHGVSASLWCIKIYSYVNVALSFIKETKTRLYMGTNTVLLSSHLQIL